MNAILSLWSLLATSKMGEQKCVFGKDDLLFGCIENQQGEVPFGDVLDAGTGMHSLRWIATLGAKGMTSYTAITADATMQRNVQQEAQHLGVLEGNDVVIGNWFGELDLPREQYDMILADYLIGAMDGFSPYRQDEMIPKLMKLLKPGGRLYIVGLEPIPDTAAGKANVICKVRQVRDACILLAGHRCYREYPADWIHSQIGSTPNLTVKETHKFPILYRYNTILRQINVGRSKFSLFSTPSLVSSMKEVLDDLERQAQEATKDGPIKFGFDYVISAEKAEEIV
jgi:SAM-dependent methyltransferase